MEAEMLPAITRILKLCQELNPELDIKFPEPDPEPNNSFYITPSGFNGQRKTLYEWRDEFIKVIMKDRDDPIFKLIEFQKEVQHEYADKTMLIDGFINFNPLIDVKKRFSTRRAFQSRVASYKNYLEYGLKRRSITIGIEEYRNFTGTYFIHGYRKEKEPEFIVWIVFKFQPIAELIANGKLKANFTKDRNGKDMLWIRYYDVVVSGHTIGHNSNFVEIDDMKAG